MYKFPRKMCIQKRFPPFMFSKNILGTQAIYILSQIHRSISEKKRQIESSNLNDF